MIKFSLPGILMILTQETVGGVLRWRRGGRDKEQAYLAERNRVLIHLSVSQVSPDALTLTLAYRGLKVTFKERTFRNDEELHKAFFSFANLVVDRTDRATTPEAKGADR